MKYTNTNMKLYLTLEDSEGVKIERTIMIDEDMDLSNDKTIEEMIDSLNNLKTF